MPFDSIPNCPGFTSVLLLKSASRYGLKQTTFSPEMLSGPVVFELEVVEVVDWYDRDSHDVGPGEPRRDDEHHFRPGVECGRRGVGAECRARPVGDERRCLAADDLVGWLEHDRLVVEGLLLSLGEGSRRFGLRPALVKGLPDGRLVIATRPDIDRNLFCRLNDHPGSR